MAVVAATVICYTLSAPTASAVVPSAPVVGVDVVVYGSQTSGLAAVRELTLAAPHLRVALVSAGDFFESPLAQGLGAEDARDGARIAGGFYEEWRRTVIRQYAQTGESAFTGGGRLVYGPDAAARALESLVGEGRGSRVRRYEGYLLEAGDRPGEGHVDLRLTDGSRLRLTTRYFIDASTEADLARALGADYRIGRDETVYNDLVGPRPAEPSADNRWVTAPQRYSALLTLEVHEERLAAPIATTTLAGYDPASYAGTEMSDEKVRAFAGSWSMNIAVLPNGRRELNEAWNDWPDIGLSFDWVFEPTRREELLGAVASRSINLVRYLQEHGYPHVGISAVPRYLYVREGPRIVGLDDYTVDDVTGGATRDPVAVGCYCEYDRHDAFAPVQIDHTRYVHVPMGALVAAEHPALLVSTAVSADFRAYSSAVRMEHTRAHMGGAAGVMVALADKLGVDPGLVPYGPVRAALLERGYRLDRMD